MLGDGRPNRIHHELGGLLAGDPAILAGQFVAAADERGGDRDGHAHCGVAIQYV
jgi:hypothetical protein